ncbi:MAG: DNA polymerase III subunit delta [Cytophagaceae bacterium]|jgi:DNA polymerase-3 subunit delta|nr:DNA polymerase III subunit delta [Cytophagaceae bacterium]
MTFDEIILKVKQGGIAPIYFLYGEEPYFIDKIAETVQRHALTDAERGFNELIMYGKDTDSTNLVHAARQYPMGAQRQLIVLREAQYMDKMEVIENYFRAPLLSTVLVISYKYKALDKRTKLYTTLTKQPQAVVFESKKMYDNQMAQWITGYLSERKLSIEPRASQLLIEFLGTELEKVAQAVEKLMVAMGAGKTQITVDDVLRNIGVSKEYNPFELQSALINKDVMKANRILKAFASNPKDNPLVVVINALFGYFSKLLMFYYLPDKNNKAAVASALKINPYFVGDYQKGARNYKGTKVVEIVSLLREYDMKGKGFGNVSTSHSELMKEMVFKILH